MTVSTTTENVCTYVTENFKSLYKKLNVLMLGSGLIHKPKISYVFVKKKHLFLFRGKRPWGIINRKNPGISCTRKKPHPLSGSSHFEKKKINRDNKLLSSNKVLLVNKQGKTSRVSKLLHGCCYEFSYQFHKSLYREISLATPFSFEFTVKTFLSVATFLVK